MSYEAMTLRGHMPCRCERQDLDPGLRFAPVVFGAKLVAGKVLGKLFGGGESPAQAAARKAGYIQKYGVPCNPVGPFGGACRSLQRTISTIASRSPVPQPSSAMLPANLPQPSPVVAQPVPEYRAQAFMDVPQSMSTSSQAASSGAGVDTAAAPPPAAPSLAGGLPLVIGGLLLLAFTRSRRSKR